MGMRQDDLFRSLVHRAMLVSWETVVSFDNLARKGSPVEAAEGRIAIISGYRLQFRKFLRGLKICVLIF
ncbi:hypothetical protein Acife_0131 [Acidithiobacillus ferrivorans SS3]|uniref:Uncharacterized protein n=2 Tax=Acidithiobacillus ferrivorans TaxID=160808 RepID=A0A1B9BV75_9PROT|nr:hypothetical protein Acife_0131 [Acidithiobacillus ferrivorans SS3]OCB01607.1 hypothetical protein BBC27_03080 [Acidithiobacillus ferrivorans]